MSYLGGRSDFLLAVLRATQEHDVEYPAASLAYYGFVALFPLLLLVLTLVDRSAAVRVHEVTPPFLTPDVQALVWEAAVTSSGRLGSTVLAILVLAWSGANVAVGFLTVVERVEGEDDRSYSEQLRGAVAVLLSLVLALSLILCTSVVFSLFPNSPFVSAAAVVTLLAVLTVAFLPAYYVPARRITEPTAALPGAFIAAVGWTTLLVVVHLYAVNASRYAIYGVISGIIIILTSVYVASFVLFLGLIVNETLSGELAAADADADSAFDTG
ncbi:YhjD/YihY/BrkB family envelope integrity protein [Halopelagius longus]|uniref:Membrane protein n=1 Tax=Halopelagius longus TaxID=1236180 RepID=A0A1H1EJQ9_9EURY|nr:YhjD/YihY/BrkB family envelope integrity protein [Halopelagius longus]RDI71775.1 YihY/virulence factor BrkB family protein [Halopelagius longus]SDQ88699.1 membrane protein [Halopelagius longus]